MFAKGVNVPFADAGWTARDKFGELRQSFVARRQRGPQIAMLDVPGEDCIAAFCTEILPVSFNSIEAVVGP